MWDGWKNPKDSSSLLRHDCDDPQLFLSQLKQITNSTIGQRTDDVARFFKCTVQELAKVMDRVNRKTEEVRSSLYSISRIRNWSTNSFLAQIENRELTHVMTVIVRENWCCGRQICRIFCFAWFLFLPIDFDFVAPLLLWLLESLLLLLLLLLLSGWV